MTRPLFVTLTGADRDDLLPGMQSFAARHAGRVEWGILWSEENIGTPRFPTGETIEALRRSGLRLSAHLCGALAERILAGGSPEIDLSGFTRVQVNLVGRHAAPQEIEAAVRFGQAQGLRTILPCAGAFPADTRLDWLLDESFGRGRTNSVVPSMQHTSAFCGIAGGISPQTIRRVFESAEAATQNRPYWIDAESALVTGAGFSLAACTRLLDAVFPPSTGAIQ